MKWFAPPVIVGTIAAEVKLVGLSRGNDTERKHLMIII